MQLLTITINKFLYNLYIFVKPKTDAQNGTQIHRLKLITTFCVHDLTNPEDRCGRRFYVLLPGDTVHPAPIRRTVYKPLLMEPSFESTLLSPC